MTPYPNPLTARENKGMYHENIWQMEKEIPPFTLRGENAIGTCTVLHNIAFAFN